MKKLVHALVLTGLVAIPALALADDPAPPNPLTANIGLTTNYVFRGISQSQNGPAIQGGIDYAHPSGFYVGTWGSNVSWVSSHTVGAAAVPFKNNNSMELDLYGGFRQSVGDFGYDVGAIEYYYPGDKISGVASPDTTEVYVSGSWKFLSLKYSHTVSSHFVGWVGAQGQNTRNSNYIEANANYDLGGGWGVLGHIGHQKIENLSVADYTDWKVGATKDVGFGVFTLAYTDTNADTPTYTWATSAVDANSKKVADGHLFLSFTKTF